jgi:hypothetical protein
MPQANTTGSSQANKQESGSVARPLQLQHNAGRLAALKCGVWQLAAQSRADASRKQTQQAAIRPKSSSQAL